MSPTHTDFATYVVVFIKVMSSYTALKSKTNGVGCTDFCLLADVGKVGVEEKSKLLQAGGIGTKVCTSESHLLLSVQEDPGYCISPLASSCHIIPHRLQKQGANFPASSSLFFRHPWPWQYFPRGLQISSTILLGASWRGFLCNMCST